MMYNDTIVNTWLEVSSLQYKPDIVAMVGFGYNKD